MNDTSQKYAAMIRMMAKQDDRSKAKRAKQPRAGSLDREGDGCSPVAFLVCSTGGPENRIEPTRTRSDLCPSINRGTGEEPAPCHSPRPRWRLARRRRRRYIIPV